MKMNGENLGIRGLSTDYIESFPSAVLLPRLNLEPSAFIMFFQNNIKFFPDHRNYKRTPGYKFKGNKHSSKDTSSTCPKTNVENQ
jgi:hypothetical protein